MCGIAGFVSKNKNIDLINSITTSMTHRGPDDINTSIYEIGNSFSFRKYAIINNWLA